MTQRNRPNDSVNSLLQAAADCTSALLSDENFGRGVNRALEILGTSVGADRLCTLEYVADVHGLNLGHVIVRYEWLSPHASSQLHHPELNRVACDTFTEEHYQLLSGKYWGGLIENYPEAFRSGQQEIEVKATYSIPVMVEGHYWGILGLDFCRTSRELYEAEIAVLKTAAACIGGAIERERNRQSKEAAERKALLQQQKAIELQERDRLLNLTANAAQALLDKESLDKAIANALEIIGQGIATDRVAVMEHCDNPTGESLGYLKMLYEWHSIDAVSQLHHPELHQVGYEGIEDWYEQLTKGEAVGGVVSELAEPIRSGQEEIGVKSTYSVPIAIDGEYWGLIGLDNCKEAKQRNETEISILKTVATCIGSAIAQHRICQQREVAERSALLQQQKAAQLQEHNQVLEQRDRILAATAEASNVLLTGTDFDEAVNRALQIIGETIDTDRVDVIENWHNPSQPSIPHWRVLYEWNSANSISQLSHSELKQGSYEGIEEWYELNRNGQTIRCRLEEMPEPFRSGQEKIGVKVLHAVPIFVDGKFWGVVGFDDCREVTHRSEAELSILKTAAACVGGAIERERTRRAKEQAERNILLEREKAAQQRAIQLQEHNQVLEQRDRILAATAEASNILLTGADFDEGVNRALQIIGETIDTDRVVIAEHIEDPSGQSLGHLEFFYEWHSIYTVSQIEQLKIVSYKGIESFYELFCQGIGFGRVIEETLEPFRSEQKAIGVKSTYSIPIMIEGKFWGLVGYDDCREATHRSEAELSILKTAAACIGGAIERERTRRAKEQAAQERARLLQAVATVANSLLRSPDYRTALPEVLQILGEAAKSDRCSLVQNVPDPVTGEAAVKICAEWCRQDIRASIDHTPELETALLWSYFPQFEEKLIQGKTSTFLIDELSEPARNILQAQGNISLTLVPIVVQGKFWGVFSFDYCQEARLFAEADTAIFAIAVDSIAAAIEREQKNEALRISEKRYRTLFELSNEGIYRFEFDEPLSTSLSINEQVELAYQYFRIAEVNTTFVDQYGFNTSEEIVGKKLIDFYPEESQKNRESNRAIIENGYRIRNNETEEIDAHNQPRYFISNVVCDVRDGYCWGGWGTQTDITELKQAQQALLEAERQRVAQLEESNQVLSLRDRWLEATANAANRLLATPDLDTGINAALKVLGKSLDCDRVCVVQNVEDSTGETSGLMRIIYEWNSTSTVDQIHHPKYGEFPNDGLEEWFAQVIDGNYAGGTIDEVPEPYVEAFIDLNIQSTYNVAIFVSGEFWGIVCIDYCREAKRLTLPEIAVFKTAASCVGSAISRQQIQQQREQAERTIILERERAAQEKAAELTKVNAVLSRSLDKLTDTADLDLFLGQVVLEITRQVGAVDGHIFLYNENNNTLETRLSVRHSVIYQGAAEHDPPFLHSPFPANIAPAFKYMLKTKEIVSIGTTDTSELFWDGTLEWHRQMGHQEVAALALTIDEKPLGMLGFAFSEKSSLKPEELELIYALTNQASLAIQLTNLAEDAQQIAILQEQEKAAQEKAAELTKVNAVLSRSLDKLTDTADLDSFLGQVVLEITCQVGAVCGHIFLYDADKNTLQQRLSVRNGIIYQGAAEHDCKLFHFPQPADISPLFTYLCQTRKISLLSINYDADSTLWWSDTIEWHQQMGLQEAASIALMIGDKPLGMLGLAFAEKSALKPEELELIYALTNQASLAIQLTNLAEDAQEYAVTSERNRMAREIHDTLAQAFTGISLQLEAAKNSVTINPEIATERLLQAKNLAKEGIVEARRSVRALRPEAMELGLSTALRQLANKMLLGTNIKPEISIEGETHTLTPQLEAELFRIAQEALTNVIRHAQATEISIQLIYEPDTIYLQIKDNGIGFNLQQLQSEGFGLLGMRERCDRLKGDLVIDSAVGRGTEILIRVASSKQ